MSRRRRRIGPVLRRAQELSYRQSAEVTALICINNFRVALVAFGTTEHYKTRKSPAITWPNWRAQQSDFLAFS
jgi:hypothetical protein